MGRYEYLVLLALCLLVTLPLEALLGVRVYRQARRTFLAIASAGVLFVAWDLLGAHLGHWAYNPAYITGLALWGLPVEEYLFFLVVPLCAILAYEAVRVTLDDVTRWLRGRRAGTRRPPR